MRSDVLVVLSADGDSLILELLHLRSNTVAPMNWISVLPGILQFHHLPLPLGCLSYLRGSICSEVVGHRLERVEHAWAIAFPITSFSSTCSEAQLQRSWNVAGLSTWSGVTLTKEMSSIIPSLDFEGSSSPVPEKPKTKVSPPHSEDNIIGAARSHSGDCFPKCTSLYPNSNA